MSVKKRVAVIFGGQSSEHEVSRVSAASILKNINSNKYDVSMIGITKDGKWLAYNGPVDKIGSGEWQAIAETEAGGDSLDPFKVLRGTNGGEKVDVVFPVLHGCNGEDGTIQGLFELCGVPYVGCGVLASAVGMDKAYTKIVFEKAGIPQGKYLVFSRKQIQRSVDEVLEQVEKTLTYPCFVKPSNAGSSVGVGKARDRKELIETLNFAAKFDIRVLVEEFINGREVECAVLGNDEPAASTVGEVVPCNEFYDYEAKYKSGNDSEVIIPARLSAETVDRIRDYAVKAYKALDCAGLSRVDFFVHKDTGEIYINEINTLPGFTSISMYPKLWEATGIPYVELIEKLIDLAVERYESNKRAVE